MFSDAAEFQGTKISSYVDFGNAVFSGEAGFGKLKFPDYARFSGATFSGEADFRQAAFSGDAPFEGATFSKDAMFGRVEFSKDAVFKGAIFSGDARFGRATFSSDANFQDTTFSGDARFGQAVFTSFTNFRGAKFKKEAFFAAMRGESHFSLQDAKFFGVPDFEQAHFAEAPRLDIAHIAQSRRLFSRGANSDLTARWRALKRIAVQGHDHERELLFFAEEIKATRGVQDRAWPNPRNLFRKGRAIWPGGARYWMGLFYQVSSDFGRSMLRPFAWWWGSTFAFALYYLSEHFAIRNPPFPADVFDWIWDKVVGCLPTLESSLPALTCLARDGQPAASALYLSIRKGSIFAGLGDADKLAHDYACLYGEKIFPDAVMYAGLVQTVISAALVFLFLLAIRNHFRIK
jgi:uncharacterized protein YjbI with pentapeptide repeats